MARLSIRGVCALFCCFIAAAQTRSFIYPSPDLNYTLRNAPLSEPERADIYRAVDGKTIHDSFPENERAKERETVMSSLVGEVRLAALGLPQVLVRCPELFCGAANCTLWLFQRDDGHLRLILETGGTGLEVKSETSQGFHDLVAGSHMSGFEQDYTLYRWDGRKYARVDSYACQFDREDPAKPLTALADARCRQ